MTATAQTTSLPPLQQDVLRQREALEQILATCDGINFPPDIIVAIAAMARQGLAAGGAAPEARHFA